MIADLKAYPAYKDTGIPWVDRVPKGWQVRRLRNVAKMLVSNVDKHSKGGEHAIRLCNYVDVYRNENITNRIRFMRATATREEIDLFRLQLNDVLITKDSEAWDDIGKPALVEYAAPDLICGYHLAQLRPREGVVTGSYLFRALQSLPVAYQFHVSANGVTRYGLSHAAIKSVWLPIPNADEQTAITRYLDHVDRRIRRYIRAKQKLTTFLNEQKQAIIRGAVTRGLDPNVRLRRSGVEWLGDVPEHWEIRRNGRLFAQRNEVGFGNLPILEVSLRTGVRVRNFENSIRKQVMSDRDKYKRAVTGDLAYNMMRMWQGACGVALVDGLVSPAYVVARPLEGTDSRYYGYLFRTADYMREVDKYSRGIVKDRNRLYWEDFKQMPSPWPPLVEQKRIADAVDQRTLTLTSLIENVDREVALIREYRTRLIADVVTGKLDVRKAAATLPAEAEDEEPLEEIGLTSEEGDRSGEDADLATPEEVDA